MSSGRWCETEGAASCAPMTPEQRGKRRSLIAGICGITVTFSIRRRLLTLGEISSGRATGNDAAHRARSNGRCGRGCCATSSLLLVHRLRCANFLSRCGEFALARWSSSGSAFGFRLCWWTESRGRLHSFQRELLRRRVEDEQTSQLLFRGLDDRAMQLHTISSSRGRCVRLERQ